MPVGSLPKGQAPSGALDLSGNAAEWCRDFFLATAYKDRNGKKDPFNDKPSFSKVIRGGSFFTPPQMCTVTVRIGLAPKTRMNWIGFRVALPAK
jgi:formylglycine-generating enzyme required for sulfatase activity